MNEKITKDTTFKTTIGVVIAIMAAAMAMTSAVVIHVQQNEQTRTDVVEMKGDLKQVVRDMGEIKARMGIGNTFGMDTAGIVKNP